MIQWVGRTASKYRQLDNVVCSWSVEKDGTLVTSVEACRVTASLSHLSLTKLYKQHHTLTGWTQLIYPWCPKAIWPEDDRGMRHLNCDLQKPLQWLSWISASIFLLKVLTVGFGRLKVLIKRQKKLSENCQFSHMFALVKAQSTQEKRVSVGNVHTALHFYTELFNVKLYLYFILLYLPYSPNMDLQVMGDTYAFLYQVTHLQISFYT